MMNWPSDDGARICAPRSGAHGSLGQQLGYCTAIDRAIKRREPGQHPRHAEDGQPTAVSSRRPNQVSHSLSRLPDGTPLAAHQRQRRPERIDDSPNKGNKNNDPRKSNLPAWCSVGFHLCHVRTSWPVAQRRADSKWRHSGGRVIKTNDPAVVPGVINHRDGWWLRWDSITVSQLLRPATLAQRKNERQSKFSRRHRERLGEVAGSSSSFKPHSPREVLQGMEPWT